jgi:hypothetical protein
MGMLQNQTPPAFPVPPAEYNQAYMNQLLNILRMFLNQVDAQQILSLNGIIFDINTLPDQTKVSSLRPGQVYVDKSANNVLKVKT